MWTFGHTHWLRWYIGGGQALLNGDMFSPKSHITQQKSMTNFDIVPYDENGDVYITAHGKKYHKQAENLYKTLLDNLPELQFAQVVTTDKLPGDIKDLFKVSIPDIQKPNYIADIPAPTLGTAEPARLWTGQELADLHNINYDVNHYYDLIKQGTEANVKLGE